MLDALLEALLFAAGKPLTRKKLVELTKATEADVQEALTALSLRLQDGGIQLMEHGNDVELVTRPDFAEAVRAVSVLEAQGELTRPSLETLAILSYRGALTRPEIEQIRGVQSSLILRNLMIRGLVEQQEDTRLGQPVYAVTTDFVKYLGVDSLESLPDYASLHAHPTVERVLAELEATSSPVSDAHVNADAPTLAV